MNMPGLKSLTYIEEKVLHPKLETLSRHHWHDELYQVSPPPAVLALHNVSDQKLDSWNLETGHR